MSDEKALLAEAIRLGEASAAAAIKTARTTRDLSHAIEAAVRLLDTGRAQSARRLLVKAVQEAYSVWPGVKS